MSKLIPDYKKIYNDILDLKFPHKKEMCANILAKETLSAMDIIRLNQKIFDLKDHYTNSENQKHKSYDKSTVFQILDYQKKNQLNNSQVAHHFKLSRNTITKWRKIFLVG